jgi:homoserine dehydrogenase
LVGNDIEGLACIINGTCNYILTQMARNKESFADALAEAQRLGYAETDPGFDIDGMDSLHKVALLASMAYGRYVDYRKLSVEGIRNVSALDIRMADEMGYEVKLLGVVSQNQGRILAAVYPALLERGHQLASVNGVLNGVYLKTSAAGPQLFTGAGAGRRPTASAVVSDLVALARQMATGHPTPPSMAFFSAGNAAQLLSIDELETEFYLRLTTVDKPGVLSKVTGILGDSGISIRALSQKPEHDPEHVPVIILTHTVKNAKVAQALRQIDALDVVRAPTRVLRFYR